MNHDQLRMMAEHRDSPRYRWWVSNRSTLIVCSLLMISMLMALTFVKEQLRREREQTRALSSVLLIGGCLTASKPSALFISGDSEESLDASLMNVASQAFQVKQAWSIARAKTADSARSALVQNDKKSIAVRAP